MGINRHAISSYLISLYCSLAVLTDDALAGEFFARLPGVRPELDKSPSLGGSGSVLDAVRLKRDHAVAVLFYRRLGWLYCLGPAGAVVSHAIGRRGRPARRSGKRRRHSTCAPCDAIFPYWPSGSTASLWCGSTMGPPPTSRKIDRMIVVIRRLAGARR